MKKIICSIAILLYCFGLTSCYQDLENSSLEDYIIHIDKNDFGYSNSEIDHPAYFLPSNSFLQDYSYLEGNYYWRENDSLRGAFTANVNPEISLLCLKYDKAIYQDEKEFMLKEIKPYNDKFYEYNSYVFYENSNFISFKESRSFPQHFTMACYNDENCTLIFMGLYSGTIAGPSCLNEKYLEDIDSNWKAFIEQYYGEYYDFNN